MKAKTRVVNNESILQLYLQSAALLISWENTVAKLARIHMQETVSDALKKVK